MNRDLVYVFDKITKKSSLLGEIQNEFNMSLVIDGTKDSATIIVWSYSRVEIEPYSIIYHKKTNTWWVVSHDKVERYQNDNGGFVYAHNLELLGAIEILNARDLTDCGFNDKTYTVYQFITRLFTLSTFEYDITVSASQNFRAKKVEFIKTFENYTLLSALREFLDAFNMCPKLSFGYTYNSANDQYTLDNAILTIISKTGDRTRVHQISEFDDVRETKTVDKNSFGTVVVSNAENVVSSNNKTFPSVGGVKASSKENIITPNNALIRLPSKVFQGNWIKMLCGIEIILEGTWDGNAFGPETFDYIPFSSENALKNRVLEIFNTLSYPQEIIDDFNSNFSSIVNTFNLAGSITLYNGNKLVPYFGSNNNQNGTVVIEQGDDVPYLVELYDRTSAKNQKFIFTDKNNENILPLEYQGILWERGSDIISNLKLFDNNRCELRNFINTDLRINATRIDPYLSPNVSNHRFQIYCNLQHQPNQYQRLNLKLSNFIVNYIPMSDLKLKVDNQRDKNDIHLYNQNGKLTDCVALSKLINSYSKEISSDTITRYMHYYSFSDVPKVGDIVVIDNIDYVINNISMEFVQNESNAANDFNYFIECEITMSKWVSAKSLMVNPNTNIRDYGIPQNYNVKRKQLYRDYYELTYQAFSDADNDPYLATEKIFSFANMPNTYIDFVAVMKIQYENQVENSYYWYYQLETTNYYFNKMLCTMLDFQDNNIIGYGSQNIFSGFNVSRIFTGMTDTVNVPISYVDDKGNFLGISIKLLTNEQITKVYNIYQESSAGGSNYNGCLYNYSVFIPSEIYEWLGTNDYEILISEPNYKKDVLEVPVFEYVCQIDDSEDVLIGDNILQQYDGYIYFYSYVVGDNLNQNNVTTTNSVSYDSVNGVYFINNASAFSYDSTNRELSVSIWNKCEYDPIAYTLEYGTRNSYTNGKDYAVFRHAYNVNTGEEIIDLMLIAKKVPHSGTENLVLKVNHYKLK